MTYAQIKQLALRQLDEDPHDMDEFGYLLGVYVNEGYQTALMDYVRPREAFTLKTNEKGEASLVGLNIRRITQVEEYPHGYSAWATLNSTGDTLYTAVKNGEIRLTAIVTLPDMQNDNDVPKIPEHAHTALADYACWRFLSNGNMAKQQRGQTYLNRFVQGMQQVYPMHSGSTRGYTGLYTVTDPRWVR